MTYQSVRNGESFAIANFRQHLARSAGFISCDLRDLASLQTEMDAVCLLSKTYTCLISLASRLQGVHEEQGLQALSHVLLLTHQEARTSSKLQFLQLWESRRLPGDCLTYSWVCMLFFIFQSFPKQAVMLPPCLPDVGLHPGCR